MAELARVGFPGLTIEGSPKPPTSTAPPSIAMAVQGALLLAVLEPGLERFDHDPTPVHCTAICWPCCS